MQARTGYAICGEPRSGSTFLGRVLHSTGVLGAPFEFFRHAAEIARAEADPENELRGRIERASSPNGVYGLKIFSSQFDLAEKTGWARRLPNLRFIHLERTDLLGQAISTLRATQTGRYQTSQEETREPHYDRARIEAALTRIAHNQARWRVWFSRNGISPLRLTYEEVAAGPQAAATAVGALLGLQAEPVADLSAVRISVLRDSLTDTWRARFVAEASDTSYLDHPLGRLPVKLRRWYSALRGSTGPAR